MIQTTSSRYKWLPATAKYVWSGTGGNGHPDPDTHPEVRNKSPNSVSDPSVPYQQIKPKL